MRHCLIESPNQNSEQWIKQCRGCYGSNNLCQNQKTPENVPDPSIILKRDLRLTDADPRNMRNATDTLIQQYLYRSEKKDLIKL